MRHDVIYASYVSRRDLRRRRQRRLLGMVGPRLMFAGLWIGAAGTTVLAILRIT
ncbi:unannotated protein [freshwater metagenome]|uniref:Unannotated protein n=1 Tax=freshwater metagenome TaxID=449393 RepID=A0A6J7DDN3_9ZZZZ|nr:hypothetical protein [Actinomycetota bacterium]